VASPVPAGTRSPLVPKLNERAKNAILPADKTSAEEGTQTISERHAKFSQDTHDYLREYIRNADQKATFFFAALTALLAFLNT
jgi:hypothetical protein